MGAGRTYNTPSIENRMSILSVTAVARVSLLALVSQAPVPIGGCKETLSASAVGCIKGDKP